MTKNIISFLFHLYQGISRGGNAACRFTPTCSQYLVLSIEKYGLLKGAWLAAKRLLSCHPFSKRPIYDPI